MAMSATRKKGWMDLNEYSLMEDDVGDGLDDPVLALSCCVGR